MSLALVPRRWLQQPSHHRAGRAERDGIMFNVVDDDDDDEG